MHFKSLQRIYSFTNENKLSFCIISEVPPRKTIQTMVQGVNNKLNQVRLTHSLLSKCLMFLSCDALTAGDFGDFDFLGLFCE